MSVQHNLSKDGDELTIRVNGRFDFSAHGDFRAAYQSVTPLPRKLVVDLSQADYMDSAALGMLLVLRERSGGPESNIHIVGANPFIRQLLSVSRFETLFKVA
jgi:anti-anti-sigma factor